MSPPRPKITFISQKVKDIKLPQGRGVDWVSQLAIEMGKLKSYLNKHSFIPANKVTCILNPRHYENGILVVDLTGEHLFDDPSMHKDQIFPLKIVGNITMDMPIDQIFQQVEDATVDDGGNIQNMIVNTSHFLSSLRQHSDWSAQLPDVVALSTSDPFELLPEVQASQLRKTCHCHLIDVEDRFSIQSPFFKEESNEEGVLAFTSEPKLTSNAVSTLLEGNAELRRNFGRSDCYVVAEPANAFLRYMGWLTEDQHKPYQILINASTAFRPEVATESFARGVILPMNNEEASEVARIFMVRGLSEELSDIERPPFPCPLTPSANDIDLVALEALDVSMFQYNRFNPFGPQHYACPISFGPQGGLLVGTGIDDIVCFTSIPSKETTNSLLKEYGRADIDWDNAVNNEVGAGDAVATVNAIFNTVKPTVFLSNSFEGRETENAVFVNLASTIFVNVISRIVGCFLYHSTKTNWTDIAMDRFPKLLKDAADEACKISRPMISNMRKPQLQEIEKWGIKVAVWLYGTTRRQH